MFLEKKDLENLLYTIDDPYGVADLLAPQEIARLSEILYGVLQVSDFENEVEFSTWSSKVMSKIDEQLRVSQSYFGIRNIREKINFEEFLEKVYKFEKEVLTV